jgi:hypothetical protein
MPHHDRERYRNKDRQLRPESGPYTGIGPKGFRHSDQQIFETVCERLTQHGRIDASRIRVEVQNGNVIFNGKVRDRQTKYLVEDIAAHVDGVEDIENQLRVEPTNYQYNSVNRVDRVGETGIYPVSAGLPEGDAEVRSMAEWGQAKPEKKTEQTSGKQGKQPRSRKQEQ